MPSVLVSLDAFQQFDELPNPIKNRVVKLAARLRNWPHVPGAKPLRGKLAGHYRLRTGDYRLQFSVEGDRIIIEKLGHRDKFYED